jgi:hypothetical protein
MTQAELWQLHLMAAPNTSEAFQVVVTIIFAFMERLSAEYGVSGISPNAFVVPASALLLALLIVASVAFLFQVRQPRRPHVSSSQPSETR